MLHPITKFAAIVSFILVIVPSLEGASREQVAVENLSTRLGDCWASQEPQLRSAFIERTRTSHRVNHPITDLRRHFNVVLEFLNVLEDESLEIAADRLARHRNETWDNITRRKWLEILRRRRATNIARLRQYRSDGDFPVNRRTLQPFPIFVDDQDTACAVGHLMRLSGWEKSVAKIARQDNNIYVTDVSSGPLVEWIVRSGLLQEEAALIQPGYPLGVEYFPADGTIMMHLSGSQDARSFLKLTSKSGLFEVDDSMPGFLHEDGAIYSPFLVSGQPVSNSLNLGPILPPGLTVTDVARDLLIEGEYLTCCLNAERVRGWQLRVNDEIRASHVPPGDVDKDGTLTQLDLDEHIDRLSTGHGHDPFLDLDHDGKWSQSDIHYWVTELKNTWIGDVDLDGDFNAKDLIAVFQSGEYEDARDNNSGWAEGDWDGDRDFTSSDLVVAFADGGYEQGKRPAMVPEPAGFVMAMMGLVCAPFVSRSRRNSI